MALVVTLPAWAPGRLAGNPLADVWNHAWGPWWWWQSLRQGALPWQTDLLHAPLGGILWFIDPVLAVVGAPLVPLLGVATAYDLALTLLLAFASYAVHRFARTLGAGAGAAWLASAAYVASAWVICEVHNGISEAVDIGPVALALALGEDACRDGRTRAWVRAGVAVGLAVLASPYLALGAAIALLVRGLPHLRRAWAGGLVALALGAPPLALLRAQLASPDAIVRRPAGMNEQLALHNAVDPRVFLAPFGFRSVDLQAEGMEHSMYLGLVAVGLAAVAVLKEPRTRPWLLAAGATALAALGPWLYWGEGWAETADGSRLALPWLALQRLAPGLAVTHPLRLAVATLAIVAALAAVGATRLLGRRAPLLLPLLLLDGLVVSGAPWPIPTAPAAYPDAHAALAATPGRQLVLDLPTDVGATMATSRYLYWQTGHGHPIPYGPDARASTAVLVSQPAFRRLAALSTRRADEHRRLGLAAGAEADLRSLAEVGVRWVILHEQLDPGGSQALRQNLEPALGPGQPHGDALLWDLGPAVEARQNHVDQLRAGRAAGSATGAQ